MISIKILGSGCANCQKLEALCKEIIAEQKIAARLEKITDVNKFADYGVFITPGLIINDKVVSSGKIPTKATLKHWIESTLVKS